MIGYSILIPQRDAATRLRGQLDALAAALAALPEPYEIIVVDDGSGEKQLPILRKLQTEHPALRVLRLDRPCGRSTALGVGIQAARGSAIVAMAVGDDARQVPRLVARLSRADFVQGKRPRRGWRKAAHRLARIPRWLLLGLDVRDPGCFFWAARGEAVAGIELSRGMHRYLATLVAARGFRVDEVLVQSGRAEPYPGERFPHPGDLLAAWWHRRRTTPYHVYELTTTGEAQPILPFVAKTDTAATRRKSA